ncbi:MAG: isomerase [Bdellovibrio sp.]|nr:MAG: isomerase [Bdellovibrio sp.]
MKFWQVDAFTSRPFGGNPAAVVILEKPLPDEVLQNIAAEMNLSETAFIHEANGQPFLRWFTPKVEVDLCGHATLAAAHIYLTHFSACGGFATHASQEPEVTFATKFAGPLKVQRVDRLYTMNFPARPGQQLNLHEVPEFVLNALTSHRPVAAFQARDLMLVYGNEDIVRAMDPDFSSLKKFDKWIIVTSLLNSSNPSIASNPSNVSRPENSPAGLPANFDFISRFFCAGDGIDEDPVTGSAHCTSTPYWARVLKKNKLRAYQASSRGGDLTVELVDDRVLISGEAISVFEGRIYPSVFSNL